MKLILFIFVVLYFRFAVSFPIEEKHSKEVKDPDRQIKPPKPKSWGKADGQTIQKIVRQNSLEDKNKPNANERERRRNFRKTGLDKKSNRRHIGRIPPPREPLDPLEDPPSGLASDQKHADSKYFDESLRALKLAFEALLDEHQRHPKRKKDVNNDKYIILKYNAKSKKYFIIEEDSDED